MAQLSTADLKKLVLPSSLFVEEVHTVAPGWAIRQGGYNFFELVGQIMALQNGSVTHATLTDNTNGTYTFTPVSGTSVLVDTRAASNPVDTTGIIPVANNTVQKALEDYQHFMNNTKSLFGVSWTNGVINPTMGTYTGWTITDNQSVKQNIQELELAVQDAIHNADNGLVTVTGTGVGALQKKVQLGAPLTRDTDITTAGFRYKVTNATSLLSQVNDALPSYGHGGTDEAAFFQGAGATDRALMGIHYNGADYLPFLFREDTVAARSQRIRLGQTFTDVNNVSSIATNQVTTWDDNGIRNQWNNTAGPQTSVYTILDGTKFRIGSSATIPPAVTQYYDLPIIDGTADQILVTNGAGVVTWKDNATDVPIYVQEFLTSEPIINRNGDTFVVIPTQYNGYKIAGYKWSVFTPNTGTFSVGLERNGASMAGTTQAAAGNAQNGNVTFTAVTIATNDRLRVITSATAGATPSGLTVVLILTK